MKKFIILLLFLFLVACDNNTDVFSKLEESYIIEIGEVITLENFTYESDSSIIEITGNQIKGVSPGVCEVVAIYDNQVFEFNITVVLNLEKALNKKYTIKDTETLQLETNLFGEVIIYSTESELITLVDGLITPKGCGEAIVVASYNEVNIEITIEILEDDAVQFEVAVLIEMYVGQKVKIEVNVKKGDPSKLSFSTKSQNLEIDGDCVVGLDDGIGVVTVKLGEVSKTIEVNVMSVSIQILNDIKEVDILDTLELIIEYPKDLGYDLNFLIVNPAILEVRNNVIYPLSVGTSRVTVQLAQETSIRASIEITVTLDPIRLVTNAHIEDVLMIKKLNTYGGTTREDQLMGGVSKFYYGNLNLVVNIINLWDNPYVGQKATKEIVNLVDPDKISDPTKRMPRTGILMPKISYITYHDTGNNNEGATAAGNISYMLSQGSIEYRARSWHYTIDEGGVYQSIPDNEITWQGDTYESYTSSIGIETCVNFGAKHNVTWQRMGKLCGELMYKYNLNMSSIKQHFDWNGKNCPQTLRRNNLYPYALSLIETEWLFRKVLNSYELTFESLTPEYLDNTGQIIKNPSEAITVSYKVTITNKANGYNESVILTSNVKPLS